MFIWFVGAAGISDGKRMKASGSCYPSCDTVPEALPSLPFPFIPCLETPVLKPNLRTNSGQEKTTQFILLVSYFFQFISV